MSLKKLKSFVDSLQEQAISIRVMIDEETKKYNKLLEDTLNLKKEIYKERDMLEKLVEVKVELKKMIEEDEAKYNNIIKKIHIE